MPITPSQSMLLAMDLQRGALSTVNDETALLGRVAQARASLERAGVEIGYVRLGFTPAQQAEIPARNKMFAPLAAGGFLSNDSPGTQLHPGAGTPQPDRVFTKRRVSAFSCPELVPFLTEHDIETLILVGVQTSGVVLSTVRAAADLDYRLIVVGDCCADPDEDLHDTLLTRVFPAQAEVINSDELAALMAA